MSDKGVGRLAPATQGLLIQSKVKVCSSLELNKYDNILNTSETTNTPKTMSKFYLHCQYLLSLSGPNLVS